MYCLGCVGGDVVMIEFCLFLFGVDMDDVVFVEWCV